MIQSLAAEENKEDSQILQLEQAQRETHGLSQ